MSSIRSRLLITIFSVLMACVGLIAVLTYSSAQEEITEIFDENMQQIALAVSAHDHTDTYFDKNNDKELKGEEEFLIQVWKNVFMLEILMRKEIGGMRKIMLNYNGKCCSKIILKIT